MKSELQVLNQLKDVIAKQLNNYLHEDEENSGVLDKISDRNIVVDFPDPDNMPCSTMFWIEPEVSDISDLTSLADLEQMTLSVYIMCKRAKSEVLIQKVFGYFTALFALIRNNMTLDEFVDFAKITTMEFYPAVDASKTIAAIEATMQIQWEKPF